ncbi:MAG: hypothetical protein WC882_04890 [Candidatus Gracilibacteria bacterium]
MNSLKNDSSQSEEESNEQQSEEIFKKVCDRRGRILAELIKKKGLATSISADQISAYLFQDITPPWTDIEWEIIDSPAFEVEFIQKLDLEPTYKKDGTRMGIIGILSLHETELPCDTREERARGNYINLRSYALFLNIMTGENITPKLRQKFLSTLASQWIEECPEEETTQLHPALNRHLAPEKIEKIMKEISAKMTIESSDSNTSIPKSFLTLGKNLPLCQEHPSPDENCFQKFLETHQNPAELIDRILGIAPGEQSYV